MKDYDGAKEKDVKESEEEEEKHPIKKARMIKTIKISSELKKKKRSENIK